WRKRHFRLRPAKSGGTLVRLAETSCSRLRGALHGLPGARRSCRNGGRSFRDLEGGAVADIRFPGGGFRAQRNRTGINWTSERSSTLASQGNARSRHAAQPYVLASVLSWERRRDAPGPNLQLQRPMPL